MTPQVIEANPRVVDDYGRVAVQRGPLVYCLEQLDQPDGVQLFDVSLDVQPKGAAAFHEEVRKDLLGGIVVLKHVGAVSEKASSQECALSCVQCGGCQRTAGGVEFCALLRLGESCGNADAGLDASGEGVGNFGAPNSSWLSPRSRPEEASLASAPSPTSAVRLLRCDRDDKARRRRRRTV